jgi:hypothetical protein
MTQPEALWLAHRLISMADDGDMGRNPNPKCSKRQAAAELRRLHEVNQELLAALNEVYITCDWHGDDGREAMSKARAAIAKAEGEAK